MRPDRTFDYVPRLDERNRAFRLAAPDPDLLGRSKFWAAGFPVLDQGVEGACIGFGCTGEAMASPVRVKFAVPPDAIARSVYYQARRIDEWEGENYEGTSVRAGMLVGREKGWWTGFRWAFTMGELRSALQEGPVVLGVEWREGMYSAPGGILSATGGVVGGHCILVTGYTPRHPKLKTAAYRLRNSWGRSWGQNGSAYIDTSSLHSILFAAGGEAAVPIGRAA